MELRKFYGNSGQTYFVTWSKPAKKWISTAKNPPWSRPYNIGITPTARAARRSMLSTSRSSSSRRLWILNLRLRPLLTGLPFGAV
jgi:hypothetical protein